MHRTPQRSDVVVGVDVGSTGTKVVALDPAGRVLARCRRSTPRTTSGSIDARSLVDVVEDLVVEACGTGSRVRAACSVGIGEDGVLTDRALNPLDEALAWFDPRRTGLFTELRPQLPPADGLGVDTDAARSLVGWSWARRRPGAAGAHGWVAVTDLPGVRWSGSAFMSDTLAARTAAWRPADRSWVEDRVLATLGSADLLPPVLPAGAVAGPLRSVRLASAGVLATDAVVVVGGHDHPVGGWAVDRMHPGAVLDSMGTAELVVAQSPVPALPRTGSVDTAPGIRGMGTTLARVVELTRNLDRVAADEPAVGAALHELLHGDGEPDGGLSSCSFVPGAAGGVPPHFLPTAPTGARSRASAVLGGLAALGARAVEEVCDLLPGDPPVFAAGGWTRSPGWMRARERVTGHRLPVLDEPEVTAVGAALLAADAVGWQVDARDVLRNPSRVPPRP